MHMKSSKNTYVRKPKMIFTSMHAKETHSTWQQENTKLCIFFLKRSFCLCACGMHLNNNAATDILGSHMHTPFPCPNIPTAYTPRLSHDTHIKKWTTSQQTACWVKVQNPPPVPLQSYTTHAVCLRNWISHFNLFEEKEQEIRLFVIHSMYFHQTRKMAKHTHRVYPRSDLTVLCRWLPSSHSNLVWGKL